MTILSKPFRIIVEQIRGYWAVYRTNAEGRRVYYSRTDKFKRVGKLIDTLLINKMLARDCQHCGKVFSPIQQKQVCCSRACSRKWCYAQQPKTRILSMQEIADKKNLQGAIQQNDQRTGSETLSQSQQPNEQTSRVSLELVDKLDNVRSRLDGAFCATERGTLQEAPQSGTQGHKPTNGLACLHPGQASSEVHSGETNERYDSEQVSDIVPLRANKLEVKALRAKDVNLVGQGGYYRCKYCGLPKYHAQGAPFPVFCPPCEALIQKDRQKAESKPASFKTLEAFKKSGHNLKGIEDASIRWK